MTPHRAPVALLLAGVVSALAACAASPTASGSAPSIVPTMSSASSAVTSGTAASSSPEPRATATGSDVVASSTASVLPGAVAATARGPVPAAWEGGIPVPVAPRWWPRGRASASSPWLAAWPRPVQFRPARRGALSGLVIALDPGHDVGNSHHVALINRKYWVGLWKTCNTTGTATNSGYPEATYAFDVVARLRRLLVANGATVMVTRDRNTVATYGPCIGARGSFGSQEKARFMVQVHADGGPSRGHGFHTIVPAYYKGYTDDIYRASRVLGLDMIAGMRSRGFVPATYLSTPLQVKKDTGAHNTSDVPIVTVETLNMRNAADARTATTAAGRQRVALGLFAGIVRYYRSL